MWYSYRLCRIIYILVGISLAAISFWHTAWPASAEDIKPKTAISAAPPAATGLSNTAVPGPKAKSAQRSYKPYFVEFRARSAASYGHMYVIYGQVNGRGEIIKSDIAGLHPAGDSSNCENCSVVSWTLGHILFVPAETGASDGDLEEKYISARYRVMVDEATFKKVSAAISKLKAENPMWNALWNNCVSFGNKIAGNLDLETPGFIWLQPKDYVERLRELNGGKPQGALKFAATGSMKASVSTTQDSAALGAPLPRKPKKQPVADLPSSQAVGTTNGATR